MVSSTGRSKKASMSRKSKDSKLFLTPEIFALGKNNIVLPYIFNAISNQALIELKAVSMHSW